MQYDNEEEKFWKHSYKVSLSEFDNGFTINADNEQDALDYAIDLAEEKGWVGLFLDQNDIVDMTEQELGEHTSGGNHGLYLSSMNWRIDQLD
jgi:hypothetical protein